MHGMGKPSDMSSALMNITLPIQVSEHYQGPPDIPVRFTPHVLTHITPQKISRDSGYRLRLRCDWEDFAIKLLLISERSSACSESAQAPARAGSHSCSDLSCARTSRRLESVYLFCPRQHEEIS